MTSIDPYRGGFVLRQTSRAVGRINARASFDVALIEARSETQSAKIAAIVAVTQHAMQGAAMISQVEQQLAQAVPLAATRLQGIGDMGSLCLGEIVLDTAIKIRTI